MSDLVLIGGGHAHVHVLKMLGMPEGRRMVYEEGIQITLICRDVHTPYSGMLPGYCAGYYTLDEIHLDLEILCRFSNVRLIHASACQITYNNNNNSGGGGGYVTTDDDRPPIRYDCLSIDIGSAPSGIPLAGVVPVKPIAQFCAHYESLQQRVIQFCRTYNPTHHDHHHAFQLLVVGGGAGGIELALSVQYKLQHICSQHGVSPDVIQVTLATRGTQLLQQHQVGVRRIVTRILKERNIMVRYQAEGVDVQEIIPTTTTTTTSTKNDDNNDDQPFKTTTTTTKKKRLVLSASSDTSQPDIYFDECLWCTSAGASVWMKENTPFATTPDGFLKVHQTYECIDHPGVFSAGDCCHVVESPRPKAGVFAVRAGPPLFDNIVRYLTHKLPLEPHQAQTHFLGLISTGNEYAIASKGNWWFPREGNWVWKWKDSIDRKWMGKYTTDLPDLEQMMSQMDLRRTGTKVIPAHVQSIGGDILAAFRADPMRCGGCGAKVGATTVSRVLRAIHERQIRRAASDRLPPPPPIDHDDAAVVLMPKAGAMIHTIDYFRSFVSDPFVFGKIAAAHALSDVHAMGAKAQSALALAVVPFAANEDITESVLLDLLAGASDVFQKEHVQLIGGHTCEGSELACGFAIQGFTEFPDKLFRKRGGQPGDQIVITKAIGTGALFAADMRAKCKGSHVVEALASMSQSNGIASRIASEDFMETGGVHACTDVTGFGLVGHLLEMLMASSSEDDVAIGATLHLRTIPFLQGGLEASSKHIHSSLQSNNARNRRAVSNHVEVAKVCPVEYPLLFDPQTAGGLLFFVDPTICDDFVDKLREEYPVTAVIGEVVKYNGVCENGLCTIGSGSTQTGERIHIDFSSNE